MGAAAAPERTTAAGATRGQNVLYQLPHDWAAVGQVLAPLLDRIDDGVEQVQIIVVTADAETAAAASASFARLAGDRDVDALAATSARRAARLLRVRPAQIVLGAPGELLALVRAAALKLDGVRAVMLGWVDEMEAGDAAPLETLMADIPKDAARVIVAREITPAVEGLVERYARRARRVAPAAAEQIATPALEFVSVAEAARGAALRRLLDELDPASAVVYVRSDESEHEARALVRALGYGRATSVRVARSAGPEPTELVVLFDIPASREELAEAVGAAPGRVIALAAPRQVASARTLAGGALTPYTLTAAAARARSRDDTMRDELASVLAAGQYTRELHALEPLLDRWDGVEIAAAALRLLESARGELETARTATGVAAPNASGAMTRLFLGVGARDEVRAGDIVGAVTAVGGITGAQVGRVEIRDNHSLVEVASAAAEDVASKLTGTTIKGRRVIARVDAGGRAREGAQGAGREGRESGRERPPRREGFSRGDDRDRPPRRSAGFDRGDRSDRSDRPRPPRRAESDSDRPRPPRRQSFDRDSERPRPPRRAEFDAERPRPPRREEFDRGAAPRAPRGPRRESFDRGDRPRPPRRRDRE